MTHPEADGTNEEPTTAPEYAEWEATASPESEHTEAYQEGWPEPGSMRKERWPAVSWMYSLVLPIAIWLTLVSALVTTWTPTETVTFTVIDQQTNSPIARADLVVENLVYRTNDQGEVCIERPDTNESITVRADGYVTVTGEWTNLAGDHQDVPIRPADSTTSGLSTAVASR